MPFSLLRTPLPHSPSLYKISTHLLAAGSPVLGNSPVQLTISLPYMGAGAGCGGDCMLSNTGDTLDGPGYRSLRAWSPPSRPGTELCPPPLCTQPRGFLVLEFRARSLETVPSSLLCHLLMAWAKGEAASSLSRFTISICKNPWLGARGLWYP